MTKKNKKWYQRIEFYLVLFLVVYFSVQVQSCINGETASGAVYYDNGVVTEISFPSEKCSAEGISVRLKGSGSSILGDYESRENRCYFKPLVPFSFGNEYEVYEGDVLIFGFKPKRPQSSSPKPELISIYPTSDTVPENLLKMYFEFSQPMQETQGVLDYITITNLTTGDEEDVFLDLPTELWNVDHTLLTLWLDPGRIKTDLIPNKELGLPIVRGNAYIITVDSSWQNSKRNSLGKTYEKRIVVSDPDTHSPKASDWNLVVPKSGSTTALEIHFLEPLDAILVPETFSIEESFEINVEGSFELVPGERILKFFPFQAWTSGAYDIIIESRLEDLAGNNMNHLFDVDLEKTGVSEPSETKKRSFTIE